MIPSTEASSGLAGVLADHDCVGLRRTFRVFADQQPEYTQKCYGEGLLDLAEAMARLLYPFNGGNGPDRYVAYGADDTTIVRIFRAHPESDTLYYEHRIRKRAAFGTAEYDSVFAWGYDRGFTLGVMPGAMDEDEMHWRWSRVVPTTITSSACSLETTAYLRTVAGKPDVWIPCEPYQLTWWFGVSGIPLDLAVDQRGSDDRTPLVSVAAFPNPFNPTVCITFAIHRETHVALEIYDVSGAFVSLLINKRMVPGEYRADWNGTYDSGSPAPSGVYFLRLQAGGEVTTRKSGTEP